MPEIRSALGATYKTGLHGGDAAAVTLQERLDLDLVQVAAWPDNRAALAGSLGEILGFPVPSDTRVAVSQGDWSVYQIAPGRYLVSAPRGATLFQRVSGAVPGSLGTVTDLGHARGFFDLKGAAAREVLARGFAIDFEPALFGPDAFAQSVAHHMSALVHRLPGEDQAFRILVLRTFARSFWEWLFETAEVFGCEVLEAKR